MMKYRKLLNKILIGGAILYLSDLIKPLFSQEGELSEEIQNLVVQVQLLKTNLDEKQERGNVTEADYIKIKNEVSILEGKVESLVHSQEDENSWSWYKNLVRPLCSIVVILYLFIMINRDESATKVEVR